MTYRELLNAIRDLGFEEDPILDEYKSIIVNAVNRSQHTIFYSVVDKAKAFFKAEAEMAGKEYIHLPPTPITADTPDDFVIELPERTIELLPLLSAYYVLLDDDERKAVMYYNTYDNMVNDILSVALSGRGSKIVGGMRLG